MKTNKLLLFFFCFSTFSFARLEWPGQVEEGGYCGSEYPPGFRCKAGLACDRQGSEDPWGGICRKPCHDDSECSRAQYCRKDQHTGFCVDFS